MVGIHKQHTQALLLYLTNLEDHKRVINNVCLRISVIHYSYFHYNTFTLYTDCMIKKKSEPRKYLLGRKVRRIRFPHFNEGVKLS